MVKELSSLDISYLIKEFKQLENSKIDRIYNTKENYDELIIVFHVTGKGKHLIKIILPSMIFMDYSKEEQGTATGLCMMLRKYLEGTTLSSIEQAGFERTIIFTSQKKDVTYYLIVELFSKGNIIFCDSNMKILNLLYEQKWKDREIKRGLTYQKPQNNVLFDENSIKQKIENTKKETIVKTIAMDLGLGGTYSEELCAREGIDKNIKKADEKIVKSIIHGIKDITNQEIKANSNLKKVCPFEMITVTPQKYYNTFNEAIASNLELLDKSMQMHDKQREKIISIIEEQKKLLEEIEKESEENQKKAELIYQNYQELESIIQIIKDARKKYGWKEIRSIIKEDKKFSKIIVDIDEKNSSIIIEMDELK